MSRVNFHVQQSSWTLSVMEILELCQGAYTLCIELLPLRNTNSRIFFFSVYLSITQRAFSSPKKCDECKAWNFIVAKKLWSRSNQTELADISNSALLNKHQEVFLISRYFWNVHWTTMIVFSKMFWQITLRQDQCTIIETKTGFERKSTTFYSNLQCT